MTAAQAALLFAGAFFLIAAMYVWMIRSNRRQYQQLEQRRQAWDADILESIITGQQEHMR